MRVHLNLLQGVPLLRISITTSYLRDLRTKMISTLQLDVVYQIWVLPKKLWVGQKWRQIRNLMKTMIRSLDLLCQVVALRKMRLLRLTNNSQMRSNQIIWGLKKTKITIHSLKLSNFKHKLFQIDETLKKLLLHISFQIRPFINKTGIWVSN